MSTAYWIDKRAFGNFINFTDDSSGGVITVGTSDQMEIEYLGLPTALATTDNIDTYVADLLMWKTAQTIFGLKGNTVQYNIAFNSVKAQRVLVNKAKSLHTSEITIKQWDY